MSTRTIRNLGRAAVLALLAVAAAPPAGAQTATAGDIAVEAAWARASMGMGRAGAAFLTLRNQGDTDDRLIAAESDVSEVAELHTHTMDGGVMRMRQVEAIAVPAGGTAVLEPGGDHVMLMGLAAPLKTGESFALTLIFETAGSVTLEVPVRALGEGPPSQ